MKIICNCGAKFAVDVTPEMIQRPVQFVCPSCGMDSSASVNEQIRAEAAAMGIATARSQPVATVVSVTPSAPPPPPAPAPVPVPSAAAPRIAIARSAPTATASASAPVPVTGQQVCLKHPGESVTSECMVCKKPMCPKCMELFGYVCSPFCRSRAEAAKIKIPEYAGQKSVVEAKLWRKVGLVTGTIATVLALIVGVWFWYAWFGSRPKPIFTVQVPEGIHSGQSEFCGKDHIIFLHGITLSRYDVKAKREVWSRELVDKKTLDQMIVKATKEQEALIKEARLEGWSKIPGMPTPEEFAKDVQREAASALELYTQGSNVWVTSASGKLIQYEWATGEPKKEVPFEVGYNEVTRDGEELIIRGENEVGQKTLKRFNLLTAEATVERFGEAPPAVATTGKGGTALSKNAMALAIAQAAAGKNGRKPMDPAAVAAQAQRLPVAGKIALPAVAANAMNQDRIMGELESQEMDSFDPNDDRPHIPKDRTDVFPSKNGFYQVRVRLLEEKLVEKKVMKDAPKTSALEGEVNASKTMEIANELLNEMQRNRGGATELEDQSRYLVTVHSMDGKAPDWNGEVSGPPAFFPLKTVTIISAGNTIITLDKSNKKLWQASLSYSVKRPSRFMDGESRYGEGPCVERGDRLYICDQAMLTAFDLNSGNVHWRLPSVGIVGLLFDDQGMLYMNTTTANPENVKFSRQIDVTQKINDVIVKVDPKTGKMLWTANEGGYIAYLSGKFIYIASWNDADGEEENPVQIGLGISNPSYVRIKRVNPSNGNIMWDYYQKRAPLDVKFHDNMIQIVYKKELQVLSYLTF